MSGRSAASWLSCSRAISSSPRTPTASTWWWSARTQGVSRSGWSTRLLLPVCDGYFVTGLSPRLRLSDSCPTGRTSTLWKQVIRSCGSARVCGIWCDSVWRSTPIDALIALLHYDTASSRRGLQKIVVDNRATRMICFWTIPLSQDTPYGLLGDSTPRCDGRDAPCLGVTGQTCLQNHKILPMQGFGKDMISVAYHIRHIIVYIPYFE